MTTLYAFILSAYLSITGTLHIDPPTMLSANVNAAPAAPVSVLCLSANTPYSIQFFWRADEDQTVDQLDKGQIEQRLHTIAEQVNGIFYRDANKWDEARLPRWLTTDDCRLDVAYLEHGEALPTDDAQWKRKRIVIERSSTYCGYAFLANDRRPGPDNWHNSGTLAYVSTRCLGAYVVAHELLHSFGAVQDGAPHFHEYHIKDEGDIMSAFFPITCSADTVDCGNDDYFSIAPAPGSYLDTYWNSANSLYLVSVPRRVTFVPLMMIGVRNEQP